MIGKFFLAFLCFCVKLILASQPAPHFTTTDFDDMITFGNRLWGHDKDKVDTCDVWLNYKRIDNRGGKKLFEYVNPTLFQKRSFDAFRDAFYHTRSKVRNSQYSTNDNAHAAQTFQTRKYIFGNFLDAIESTPIFRYFHVFFYQKGHPWFSTGYHDLKLKLVDFWVTQNQDAGFDYIFMGKFKPAVGTNQPATYGGMNNWVAYHLSEENNLIHYNNPPTSHPNNKNENLRRYGLITGLDFGYNDYRYNSGFSLTSTLHQSMVQKSGHSMLMRTSPAFEFCLYTTIALMNNDNKVQSNHNGVRETVSAVQGRPNMRRITKTAAIEIEGCPMFVRVTVIKEIGTNSQENHIENVYPMSAKESDGRCNLAGLAGYAGTLEKCGENPHGLYIDHLQRKFNSTLKL